MMECDYLMGDETTIRVLKTAKKNNKKGGAALPPDLHYQDLERREELIEFIRRDIVDQFDNLKHIINNIRPHLRAYNYNVGLDEINQIVHLTRERSFMGKSIVDIMHRPPAVIESLSRRYSYNHIRLELSTVLGVLDQLVDTVELLYNQFRRDVGIDPPSPTESAVPDSSSDDEEDVMGGKAPDEKSDDINLSEGQRARRHLRDHRRNQVAPYTDNALRILRWLEYSINNLKTTRMLKPVRDLKRRELNRYSSSLESALHNLINAIENGESTATINQLLRHLEQIIENISHRIITGPGEPPHPPKPPPPPPGAAGPGGDEANRFAQQFGLPGIPVGAGNNTPGINMINARNGLYTTQLLP